ncbi:MAG: sugar phosphate isomerase/epimerase, partial [Bacteroidales bacterium]|nr:sugar phosphate isomerase/epimerase [Bacteroidales bacterium]
MDRKDFFKTSFLGAATIAAASVGLTSCSPSSKKNDPGLKLSFQEGIAPGESLSEKLDFMENLGIVGFEPSGKTLVSRVDEIRDALKGRNIKVSAICAGFKGFILAE